MQKKKKKKRLNADGIVQGMPGVIDCPQAVAAAPTGEEPCQET